MRSSRGAALCVLLSLFGLCLAGYLTYLHFGLIRGEFLGGPACASGIFNCHAVTGGRWGVWLGMPLSVWGLLGYSVALGLSLLSLQSAEWAESAMTLLFGLSLLSLSLDVYLLVLMAFVIQFYCLFCLLTYLVNLSLLVVSTRSLGRPWPQVLSRIGSALTTLRPSATRPAAWLFWGVVLIGVGGSIGVHAATSFIARGPAGALKAQLRDYVARVGRVSLTVAGDPTIGPTDAPIQIVEFSDFLCPACQQASKINPLILANYRTEAQFVFKNYPLDAACNSRVPQTVHPGACHIAAALECAHLQGKFWPFHDLIFHEGKHYTPSRLQQDAQRLGLDLAAFRSCVDSGQGMTAVQRDIAEAARANVNRTPTYIVNGVPLAGGISPVAFDDLVAVVKETAQLSAR